MSYPFFSVIIPTKNRPLAVTLAVKSVLAQTFSSYEVVIIDNDDTTRTQEALSSFTDARIRYVRTGGLSMPDNWEVGYANAVGLYQLLLEDKSVLKTRALQTIHTALQQTPAKVVSWPQDLFNDLSEPPDVLRGCSSGEVTLYSSEELLRMFMTIPRGHYETKLPRGLNSCLHRDLKKEILASPLQRVCPRYSPDYTLAFLQLRFADTF